MITSWDDNRRMADADHGITAADVADESLSVSVWQEFDGGAWFWEVWESVPVAWSHAAQRPEWDEFAVDGGTADSREEAEAAGEQAKADYLRSLTGK